MQTMISAIQTPVRSGAPAAAPATPGRRAAVGALAAAFFFPLAAQAKELSELKQEREAKRAAALQSTLSKVGRATVVAPVKKAAAEAPAASFGSTGITKSASVARKEGGERKSELLAAARAKALAASAPPPKR